jgi:polar amino acid transport system substrate-binding protein
LQHPTVVWRLLLSAGAALVLTTEPSSALAQAPPAKPLLWAADAEGGQPYVFPDPEHPDQLIGFEKEIADALAVELGRPIEFKQYAFKNIILGVQQGDFDFAMNGYEITDDREKQLRFSKPYYIYRLQLVARADDHRFEDLASLKALKNIQVGTLDDTAAFRILKAENIPTSISDDQTTPYLALENGQIDAVLLDKPIAMWAVKHNSKLRFAGPPTHPGKYAIAFDRKNEALATEVDAALDRLRANGKLRDILTKWGLWDDAQDMEVGAGVGLKWSPWEVFVQLLKGAGVTIELSVFSMMAAVFLGLIVAMCRLYGPWPLRWLAVVYVEFFRGIPVLLLLFFIYYGLPGMARAWELPWSFQFHPIVAAVLGFGLNYAAYESEIYRAGLGAVPVGQWEAAASLGMSRWLTFRRIILPQAIRIILPPMTNDFIGLLKDTSVVSIVAVVELTKEYQILAQSTLRFMELGLATAFLYLIMSVPLGYLSRSLEKRWGAAI